MNLTGPNLSVDTACSASLVAANSGVHMMRPRGDGLSFLSLKITNTTRITMVIILSVMMITVTIMIYCAEV